VPPTPDFAGAIDCRPHDAAHPLLRHHPHLLRERRASPGTAYSTIAADVLARYHKVRGRDTYFLTGTDEHGLKLERIAKEQGLGVQAFVDR